MVDSLTLDSKETVSNALGYRNESEYWAKAVVGATHSVLGQIPNSTCIPCQIAIPPRRYSWRVPVGYTTPSAHSRKREYTEVVGRNVENPLKRFQTAHAAGGQELPSAGSDTNEPSIFRYSGAFASTSAWSEQEADLESVSSVSPTDLRMAARK